MLIANYKPQHLNSLCMKSYSFNSEFYKALTLMTPSKNAKQLSPHVEHHHVDNYTSFLVRLFQASAVQIHI